MNKGKSDLKMKKESVEEDSRRYANLLCLKLEVEPRERDIEGEESESEVYIGCELHECYTTLALTVNKANLRGSNVQGPLSHAHFIHGILSVYLLLFFCSSQFLISSQREKKRGEWGHFVLFLRRPKQCCCFGIWLFQ